MTQEGQAMVARETGKNQVYSKPGAEEEIVAGWRTKKQIRQEYQAGVGGGVKN
jgi:hypothetical protein